LDGSLVQLENLAWSNLVSRPRPWLFRTGFYLKSTDPTRLYVGSFVPQNSAGVNDYPTERGIWNYFNRVPRTLKNTVATATWTYNNVAGGHPTAQIVKSAAALAWPRIWSPWMWTLRLMPVVRCMAWWGLE